MKEISPMTQPLIPSLDADAAVELVSPDSPALAKAVACASGGVLWRIRGCRDLPG